LILRLTSFSAIAKMNEQNSKLFIAEVDMQVRINALQMDSLLNQGRTWREGAAV
jgi:hypothetical protein